MMAANKNATSQIQKNNKFYRIIPIHLGVNSFLVEILFREKERDSKNY